MRLFSDEQACFRILGDFVARPGSAALFVRRFRHLWNCGRADGIDSPRVEVGMAERHDDLDAFLEGMHILCETYAYHLPDGRGYRVSEEQFRKEVQSRMSTLPLGSPPSVRHTVANAA